MSSLKSFAWPHKHFPCASIAAKNCVSVQNILFLISELLMEETFSHFKSAHLNRSMASTESPVVRCSTKFADTKTHVRSWYVCEQFQFQSSGCFAKFLFYDCRSNQVEFEPILSYSDQIKVRRSVRQCAQSGSTVLAKF